MKKSKKIILSAMLLALVIILSRFVSIETQFLVISLDFIPIMICAILLGPKYSTLIAVLGDLIGAILFPFGSYFPGFTISAGIRGLIYGLILYNKSGEEFSNLNFLIRLTVSSVLVLGVVNIFITSFWLHMLYGKAYFAIVVTRVTTQVIMLPIQIITVFSLNKFIKPVVNKYLFDS